MVLLNFQDALNVVLPSTVDADVYENVFYKYCECGIKDWLAVVCGAGVILIHFWNALKLFLLVFVGIY